MATPPPIPSPRDQEPYDSALQAADRVARPGVGVASTRWAMPALVLGVLLLGGLTFYSLQRARTAEQTPLQQDAAVQAPPVTAQVLPPPPQLPAPAAPPPQIIQVPVPVPTQVAALPATSFVPSIPPALPKPTPSLAPPVIVDLSIAEAPSGPTEAAKAGAALPADKLSADEQFAQRLNRSSAETEQATRISSVSAVVPQGALITGVLETGINSDLPGLVRGVVSRDVTSFDGSQVLIPRGSQLIGQYRSGVALGQTRVFVIWTRLLRSDGVSVQLGSAATDELGVAGLGGKVNTRFLRRFGAATLLSVITAGLGALAGNNSNTQVLIGSQSQAGNLAAIALQREIDVPTTITVPQGTPIRVIVAKDLDFSPVLRGERAR
jgi:type IV secretory pathway VirB10-like protein